jgi:hypothetical protein
VAGKIRFLHIPKTAGSTFDECLFLLHLKPYFLRRQFVFSGNVRVDRERFAAMPARSRQRIALCTGHAPLHTGCPELDRLPTVTLLRDPVERVKSFCQHISEGKSPKIYRVGRGQAFELDALLASGRIQLNNFQSRMILGGDDYQLPPGDTAAVAEHALARLAQELACFGLTEDLDRSLLLFRRILGWRRWPVYRSRNRKNPAAVLHFEQRHIDRIRELNRVDEALYCAAKKLFEQRLARHCPDMEPELAQFRLQQDGPKPLFRVLDAARALGRLKPG